MTPCCVCHKFPADVVQRYVPAMRVSRENYYCLACLRGIGVSSARPFGWDGLQQQPIPMKDDPDFWRCEWLGTHYPLMIERVERVRRNNP